MIRSTPMINTARLTLCAMRPEDFARFAEIWGDPQIVRRLGGRPLTRGEAWGEFLRNAGHWNMTGFGHWAVVLQSTRQMVGQAGFLYGNRCLGEDFDAFPEAGCVLASEVQGHGLGLEAAQAAHDWFDRVIPGPLVALMSATNTVSINLAERLGYRPMRETEHAGRRVLLFRRDGPPVRI